MFVEESEVRFSGFLEGLCVFLPGVYILLMAFAGGKLDGERERLRRQLEEAEDAEAAARAKVRRLRKVLREVDEKERRMFKRELSSIEEMERLEKEDRDARRVAGEDVPTPERSPSPPIAGSSNPGVL